MKGIVLFTAIFFLSCSSLPRGGDPAPVNMRKEMAAKALKKGQQEYSWNAFDSAIREYEKALTMSAAVDWVEGMTRSLVLLSRSRDRQGQREESGLYLSRAMDLVEENHSPLLDILVMNRKTEHLLIQGKTGTALEESDLLIPRLKGLTTQEAGESWRIRAVILKEIKQYDKAVQAIDKALEIDRKYHYIAETASDFYIKSSLFSLTGKMENAVENMLLALEHDKLIENSPAIAQDLFALGLIYEKYNSKERAGHYFRRAYGVYKASGRDFPGDKFNDRLKADGLDSADPLIQEGAIGSWQ